MWISCVTLLKDCRVSSPSIDTMARDSYFENMADVCEVRPRVTQDGWNVTWGTLCLWYPLEDWAINYAIEHTPAEVRVYDEKGRLKRTIPSKEDRKRFGSS